MISTHAPAGGATLAHRARKRRTRLFLLTPLREGRRRQAGGAEGGVNFYSRPCGRGDQRGGAWLLPIGYFYSRPCGRGDTTSTLLFGELSYFYSRPCGRGDQQPQNQSIIWVPISTHAPAGGATPTGAHDAYNKGISTHAPAGGATGIAALRSSSRGISTHAPAGGATLASTRNPITPTYFYSRPCGRGDVIARGFLVHDNFISTHAPAGGATVRPCPHEQKAWNFYSRPCGRGDSSGASGSGIQWVFLLTPLREGRRTTESK